MRIVYTLIALAVLAGCGHKGPLYLPKPKPGEEKPEVQKPQPLKPIAPPVAPGGAPSGGL
jgi:predicted small lipoprotein YifL